MHPDAIKARLVLLWLLQAVNFCGLLLIMLFEAGRLVHPPEETSLAPAGALFLVALMSWMTLVCRQRVSRWPNTVVTVGFFGYFKLAALVGWYPTSRSPAIFLNEAWGLIAALGVVWYAWQRPRQAS